MSSIRKSRQTYQIEFKFSGEGGSSSLRSLRRSDPDDDEDNETVGLADETKTLKAELMKEGDRRVISVVGMGGLGKTTLAKKVFKDDEVKRHFDCRAWAFVSQPHAPKEILTEILIHVGSQSTPEEKKNLGEKKSAIEAMKDKGKIRKHFKGLEVQDLISHLNKELRGKRYLVVLDDIWSIEAWSGVKSAFPQNGRGSKVVFTTRHKEVAISADPHSPLIEPSLLTDEDSWKLLQKKAFRRESSASFQEFKELGEEMLESCGGLPLAVVVLGGLLSTKPSLDGWKQVQKIVKTRIGKLKLEHEYGVEKILELSFLDLPYYLRQCFLYLGILPTDEEIPKRDIVRVYIAEGFLPDPEGDEVLPEDVAEQCLDDLVKRCMVQVGQLDHTGKSVKTYKLQEPMRKFCISKSKEENFIENVTEDGDINMVRRSHRIVIDGSDGLDTHSIRKLHPCVRSLFFAGTDALSFPSLRKKNLALLRVLLLDFSCGNFERSKLPVEIGDLIHLRYLRFSGAYSKTLKLPHSLGNLRNLRTLDVKDNISVLLPSTMSGLINLRHLLLPYGSSHPNCWILRKINLFGNIPLSNIETLKWISAGDLIRSKVSLTLNKVRYLGIEFKSHQEYNTLVPLVSSQLVSLRSFGLIMEEYSEVPNLELLSHCAALSRIHIVGKLSPKFISDLPKTLSKLKLECFDLNKEHLTIIEKLETLRILELGRAALVGGDKKLVFSLDGFPKLEIVSLISLHAVEELEVEKGAMPKLERLDILYIPELVMLPEGLKYISSLRELNISGMKKAFEDRVRVNEDGSEGADFHKVRHVPSISISNTWDYN